MTTTTCTAGNLAGLLTDVLRFAGTDISMPMLNGVLLHTVKHNGGVVLAATATDRFTLAQGNIDATGALPRECFIRSDDARRLLAMLKLSDSLVELSVADDALTASGGNVQCTVPLGREDFPKVAQIIASHQARQAEPGPVRFNARLFERFTAVAKATGDRSGPLTVTHTAPNKPAFVTIGERFRGLVMPMRIPDGQLADVPFFAPPSEQAALDQLAAEKVAAELKAKRSAASKKAAATRKAKAAAANGGVTVSKGARASRAKAKA